jgi:ribonuclease P protein component
MSSLESVLPVLPANPAVQQRFGFDAARRLDKIGFANILTPTKEIRVASLARRGFVKETLSQGQFFLRSPQSLPKQPQSTQVAVEPESRMNDTGRMGAVAPKRLLKRAVLRNRAKRIMRETARQHGLMKESVDFIVFLREKAPLKTKVGRKQFALDVKTVLDRTLEQVDKAKKRVQNSSAVISVSI